MHSNGRIFAGQTRGREMEPDTLLKIWAVIGPLLAATASAVWSRRVQLADREYEDGRAQARLDREDRARQREIETTRSAHEYEEAKAAIGSFMAASHHFVARQTDLHNNILDAERKAVAIAANEKFVHHGQLVMLLADHELEVATIALWNSTLSLPRPHAKMETPESKAAVAEYRTLRAEFNLHAKRFLKALKERGGG